MRYVRFLKTPRIVIDGKLPCRRHISCLITITSDLGDSFLPYDVQLTAELLESKPLTDEKIIVWSSVQWNEGMRSLSIKLPLPKSNESAPLRLKVGVEPKSTRDDYRSLFGMSCHGIVSVWSSPFHLSGAAAKFAERRFALASGVVTVWEETGNSIARHLWDAGVAFSCQFEQLLHEQSALTKALFPHGLKPGLRVLELGTGCGIVGISLAQILPNTTMCITDLSEAKEIAERNLSMVGTAKGSSIQFQELNWDTVLQSHLVTNSTVCDLVLAADCTYNPDSSPLLVNTISRLIQRCSSTVVAVAMKMRHPSEALFFELMEAACFVKLETISFNLPGDAGIAEEKVDLYIYQYQYNAD